MTEHAFDGPTIERDVLGTLKPFQRTTVEHVFHKLYTADRPSDRFLVADEVGLGKTLIARGVIAKAINHLQQQGIKRIDVVYICSNAEIAGQNIQRLNVTNDKSLSQSTRLTLLPTMFHQISDKGLNFISFTPGTSFSMTSSKGTGSERAVLYRLLQHALSQAFPPKGIMKVLRGDMKLENFEWTVHQTKRVSSKPGTPLDSHLADRFSKDLHARPELMERLRAVSMQATPDRTEATRVIWDLRKLLAQSCVHALEPDLVIMDEFQRFRELLAPPDPEDLDDVRLLAHRLFTHEQCKVLLLSATPYKMYTLRDEQDEDHYADFLNTAGFLFHQRVEERDALAEDLQTFRMGLLQERERGIEPILETRDRIQERLKEIIVRTERPVSTKTGDPVLGDTTVLPASLAATDIRAYCVADRVSQFIGSEGITDYWKSAPYLLNFMTEYKLKQRFRDHLIDSERSRDLAAMLDRDVLLNREMIDEYAAIDPGNGRLRALMANTVDKGAWRLLWLPPSLPYYRGHGPYVDSQLEGITKRLVFSSWNVVPDSVSVMLSYAAERAMMHERDPAMRNTPNDRQRLRGLLTLRRGESATASMSTFLLLYPAPQLARIIDPLKVVRMLRTEAGSEVTAEAVLKAAEDLLRTRLAPLVNHLTQANGPVDQRWYWALPILLDRTDAISRETVGAWLDSPFQEVPAEEGETGETIGWSEVVRLAKTMLLANELSFGPAPDDLYQRLAQLAIGSPAICAYRALGTISGSGNATELVRLQGSLAIAQGFRSLYNVPEVMSLLRGSGTDDADHYWQRCLQEGVNGNLQSVLDEFLELLPDWLGVMHADIETIIKEVSTNVADVLMLRSAVRVVDDISVDGDRIDMDQYRMRTRFALPFGGVSRDEAGTQQRIRSVRAAFNSPFWPFVLISTSVGQEGLDFHQYCHAVVHWNLPANPVDFEQREGRVNRYKGHAIRKNVAQRHGDLVFAAGTDAPWSTMFEAAVDESRANGTSNGMEPFWIYGGTSRIERYLPLLPMSREYERLAQLQKTLAAYRMVFGQPRQDDLLALIGTNRSECDLEKLTMMLRIDLSPDVVAGIV